jgi:hypothetical protein
MRLFDLMANAYFGRARVPPAVGTARCIRIENGYNNAPKNIDRANPIFRTAEPGQALLSTPP